MSTYKRIQQAQRDARRHREWNKPSIEVNNTIFHRVSDSNKTNTYKVTNRNLEPIRYVVVTLKDNRYQLKALDVNTHLILAPIRSRYLTEGLKEVCQNVLLAQDTKC